MFNNKSVLYSVNSLLYVTFITIYKVTKLGFYPFHQVYNVANLNVFVAFKTFQDLEAGATEMCIVVYVSMYGTLVLPASYELITRVNILTH